MTNDQIQELLSKHVNVLSEHFDAVQILVTHVTPDGNTTGGHRGSGNWYARQALAQEFIEKDKARTLAYEINSTKSEN